MVTRRLFEMKKGHREKFERAIRIEQLATNYSISRVHPRHLAIFSLLKQIVFKVKECNVLTKTYISGYKTSHSLKIRYKIFLQCLF